MLRSLKLNFRKNNNSSGGGSSRSSDDEFFAETVPGASIPSLSTTTTSAPNGATSTASGAGHTPSGMASATGTIPSAASSAGTPASSSSTSTATATIRSMWNRGRSNEEKLQGLAAFDACIMTADALGSKSINDAQETSILTIRRDWETGLTDCSVLVSADGDLLLVNNNQSRKLCQSHSQANVDDPELETDAVNESHYSNTSDDTDVADMFHQLITQGKDDYESAIFVGNDLHGESVANGFSAKGWSIPSTSHALYQTEQFMQHTNAFCHTMLQHKEQAAADTSKTCDKWSQTHPSLPSNRLKRMNRNHADWELIDPRAADFEETAERMGPFQSLDSTLYNAFTAFEQYHARTAQADIERCRKARASEENSGPGGFYYAFLQAAQQTSRRVSNRQHALDEITRRVRLLEDKLVQLKCSSDKSWDAVYHAEGKVTKKVEKLMKERSQKREEIRLKQIRLEQQESTSVATSEDILGIVSSVAASMDDGSFEPMDIPSSEVQTVRESSKHDRGANSTESLKAPIMDDSVVSDTSYAASAVNDTQLPSVSREMIEKEVGLPELRAAALKSDEDIEDTANELLKLLSFLDTARRSARTAAETCLVAAGNSQVRCLRQWIELERASLEERLIGLQAVEELARKIDVRSDLDKYITSDKKTRGGSSHLGDDDDGGVASALATLSSHVDGIMGSNVVNTAKGSSLHGRQGSNLEALEKGFKMLFMKIPELKSTALDTPKTGAVRKTFEESLALLCDTLLEDLPHTSMLRSSLCFKLNAKRSSHAELKTQMQFDGLCRVFSAILTGCQKEDHGVSNAKMCIMLAQTFYFVNETKHDDDTRESNFLDSRSHRVYIRSRLQDHPIWSQDEFWDEALNQQLSEALTHSGVMSNFEKQKIVLARKNRQNSEWGQTRKTKWHDLNSTERVEAASQVHAVVFAQLGALAHSMIEFGCSLERSCAFVRRMSIRNQLPSSHRTMLLQHLIKRDNPKSLNELGETQDS